MNLSNSYPDLFVYKILQWFIEHIFLNIIVKFIFLLLFFLYIKNGGKNWKKDNKRKKTEKKTGKKINEDAILIKSFLDKKYRPIDIAKEFNISKQKVNYWKKTEIKTEIHRRLKLNQEDIDKIIKLAENKTTSQMSCRKIANIMNTQFEK